MRQLSETRCKQMVGGLIGPEVMLLYLMVAAGAAGIYKILTSATGKLSITGMTFQWGK